MNTEFNDNTVTEQISIIWHIEDVQSIRPDLTNNQAGKVLEHLKENHDANLGINWEVIEIVADILYPLNQIHKIQHPSTIF